MPSPNHAYREAGHVVMCIARGVTFDYVSITDSDVSLCRYNAAALYFYQYRAIPSQALKAMAFHAVLIALAGPAAVTGSPVETADDLLSAAILVAENIAWFYSRNPDQFLTARFREARKVMQQQWDLVEQVVGLLNEHRRLHHAALLNLLGLPNP